MKILFLLRSLDYGGIERQLVVLSQGLCQRGHDVVIAVFYPGGSLERELTDSPVRILTLNKQGRWDLLRFFMRLIRVVRNESPDVIHSYLFDPNLVSMLLKACFPRTKIVWGIPCSYIDFSRYNWLVRVSFALNRRLSRFADAIISNSQAGREYYRSLGYPAENIVVIRNGIDTERFRPDSKERARIRAEWGVIESESLVGLVGRLDPMKDHPVFLQAAASLAKQRKELRFVCVGDGVDHYRVRLHTLARTLGLEERVLWAGAREDMPAVYNALDIAVSSSYGEGLPNVIAEAMACGVPCVVTDVGDSAWVVGDRGEVVPPKDPVALMNAINRCLDRRSCSPLQIRQRILDHLAKDTLVMNTERTLSRLLEEAPA